MDFVVEAPSFRTPPGRARAHPRQRGQRRMEPDLRAGRFTLPGDAGRSPRGQEALPGGAPPARGHRPHARGALQGTARGIQRIHRANASPRRGVRSPLEATVSRAQVAVSRPAEDRLQRGGLGGGRRGDAGCQSVCRLRSPAAVGRLQRVHRATCAESCWFRTEDVHQPLNRRDPAPRPEIGRDALGTTERRGDSADAQRRGRSMSTMSAYSWICSSTSSRPSGERSKSRTSNCGGRSTTRCSAPVCRSITDRFL